MSPSRWAIGPIEIPAGQWTSAMFPAPGYGRPKAEVKSVCEANGVVDYPLSIEGIEVECEPDTAIMLDDVEVWSQVEPAAALRMRLILDKPGALLYRNDTVRLGLANTWLWGQARLLHYSAALTDIAGKAVPLGEGDLQLAPGLEQTVECKLNQLKLGSYGVQM